MKFARTLLSGLFCLAMASWAFGDEGSIQITYESRGVNAPLGCPCENTALHPYADGVPICIFWDNNANGPDTSDVQVEEGEGYGQALWSCMAMNGQAAGLGLGFFDTDPYFYVPQLPEPPDTALYYLQVNSGGCCWRSDVFTVPPGVDEWFTNEVDWHCVNSPCGTSGEVPSAPVNCVASNDLYCLSVLVTWQHIGQNVSGFNIYADDTLVVSAGSTERFTQFTVYTDRVRSYRVRAFNGAGESAPSNADNGSTYQLRFALGPSGNLTGNNRHGQQFTLQFERPTPECITSAQLWLLVNNQRHSLLCRDSLITSMTCTLPAIDTLNFCRILLVDSSLIYPQAVLTDTTDSVFHLGIPGAVGDPMQLLPDRFELAQNFPNPFNPETEIMFSVPNPSAVRIQIYNVMGQHVRTLTDTHYPMGVHRIQWNGRSDAGVAVGAGVYIYRMEAPGFVQTRKMLLMK
ncbi:MAG: T9SS type A sorting domain-containing protein [bacterium]|nr:T9SS type A sorting domain-containing protein [bacterium]